MNLRRWGQYCHAPLRLCGERVMQESIFSAGIRRVVDAARGIWIRRLIDYSRGNSLLFYRDLKVGTLDVSSRWDIVGRLLADSALAPTDLIPALDSEESESL